MNLVRGGKPMARTVLHTIVEDIGGEVLAGGTAALCPGPGHSPVDRSMSLKLGDNNEIIVNSFSSRTDWMQCRRWLEDLGYLKPFSRRSSPTRPAVAKTVSSQRIYDPSKIDYARSLWNKAVPAAGSLVARYHVFRGLSVADANSNSVRFLEHCDTMPYGTRFGRPKTLPAMVCRIDNPDGALCGVHLTFLNARTGDRMRTGKQRLILGRMMGGAIRMDAPGRRLLVAEGYETARAASHRFNLPAWSLLSSKNFFEWIPPAGVDELTIAGDPGEEGKAAADALAETCWQHGVRPIIEIPDNDRDWAAQNTSCG